MENPFRHDSLSREQREVVRRQEKLAHQLGREVVARYERYAADLALLQKANPEATMFGVSFDAETETLSASPVAHVESFSGVDDTGFAFGQLSSYYSERVSSDVTATIHKKSADENSQGSTAPSYTLEMTRHNVQTTSGDEPDRTLLALDVTKGISTIEIGPLSGQEYIAALESGIEAFHRAFPKTEA